jgi:hypothetical protein
MSHKRLSTWQKATALVPLALLSGAWTTSLALTGTATAATKESSELPDGTGIPSEAIEAPASLSRPGEIAPGVPAGAAQTVISSASTNGIPAAALAAYQRAAQVINSADPSCRVSWQLIAAIGRVESDHGRYGGNTLSEDGKSTPGIFGIPLDGSNGTARITDTDAGQYDDDRVYDRAVGPMQFIPTTWSVVGVDADGDDHRDPQDIDDAALASAVYLCSGDEDLSTTAGQRSAVYRYNHSQEYVDLVLSIMNAYLDGDFASVPTGAAAPTVFAPISAQTVPAAPSKGSKTSRKNAGDKASNGATTGGTGGSSGSTGSTGGTGANGGNSTPDPVPSPPAPKPTKSPVEKGKDTVKDVSEPVTSPIDKGTGGGMTKAEAEAQCLAQGISALDAAALAACVEKLTG